MAVVIADMKACPGQERVKISLSGIGEGDVIGISIQQYASKDMGDLDWLSMGSGQLARGTTVAEGES